MNSKVSNNQLIREKLEERIKFFLDKQTTKYNGNNLIKTNSNDKSNSPTLKDSLIHVGKGKQVIEKTQKNNNLNPIHKKNANISSLSTQIHVTNDLYINYSTNKKENQTIPMKKEMLK